MFDLKGLPALYENESKTAKDVKVPVKLFNVYGKQAWYVTEFSPEDNLGFGFCK